MEEFDQQPLHQAPPDDVSPTVAPARRAAAPIVIIVLVGLALGAAGAWWWTRAGRPPSPSAGEAATPAPDAAADVRDPATALPPLNQMDTYLRALLGALSTHPDFMRWLATDDLVRQMARGIDRLSLGQSPASDLAVLRPSGEFDVDTRRSVITISPDSYRRYDRHVALIESLDPAAVVEAYHTIHPRLDEAYRALGRTDGGVDTAVRVALKNLIEAPLPPEPVQVVAGRGSTYAYSHAQYERLSAAQKQLLRMGPDNARRVQARLREIEAALERAPRR